MQAKNQFSRRQIRIKIFQILYGLGEIDHQENLNFKKLFLKDMNNTENSFAALALFIVKVFDYTLIHANRKASKYILTEADNIDTSLTEIDFLASLKNNDSLIETIKHNNLQNIYPEDLVRTTFLKLLTTDEYKSFHIDKNNPQHIEDLILRTAEYAIDTDEHASEFFEEKFINWEDDVEVIQRWLHLLIKQPEKIVFQNTLTQDKIDFASELLLTYKEKYEYINQMISPKLKNWDADRVAVIDLILLRLGLAEMLYFPAIPVKVSINEYIDIAKMYSTEQSGQFVNGVLDNLRKSLEQQGELRKHS